MWETDLWKWRKIWTNMLIEQRTDGLLRNDPSIRLLGDDDRSVRSFNYSGVCILRERRQGSRTWLNAFHQPLVSPSSGIDESVSATLNYVGDLWIRVAAAKSVSSLLAWKRERPIRLATFTASTSLFLITLGTRVLLTFISSRFIFSQNIPTIFRHHWE